MRTSGPSTLNKDQIAERGARLARRDDREYRESLREEQRGQPGCPAPEVVLDQRRRATGDCRCVVLDANPLDNITNTRKIAAVYQRGQAIDRAALRKGWTGN
jgi:hypothetical protein